METKKCTKCGEVKSLDEFENNKSMRDGKINSCKSCRSKYHIKWYKKNREERLKYAKEYQRKNKEKISAYQKEYQIKNREKISAYQKEYHKKHWREYYEKNREERLIYRREYYKKNKAKILAYDKEYRKIRAEEDYLFKLRTRLRKMTVKAFKKRGWSKNTKTQDILSCSWETAKNHIESQFANGMTWDNNTIDGWHIDHIIPLASAKTEEELIKLNHYKNLQPLWAEDNLSKGDSMPPLCAQYKIRKAINW